MTQKPTPKPPKSRPLPWPATLLDAAVLYDLHCISLEQRVPITRLLARAARDLVAAESARMAAMAARCAEPTGATTSSDPGMHDPNNTTRAKGTSHA